MPYLSKPNAATVNAFLEAEQGKTFTYPTVGATKNGEPPKDYDLDDNKVYLGHGQKVFTSAVNALNQWQHFPPSWTEVQAPEHPPFEAQTVAVLFKVLGLWWLNSARIVYVLHETNKYGFAYGTLPGHIECGEEVFYVEMHPDESVYYHIKAFSKPNRWFVKLGYPLARHWQRQFVKESKLRMQQLCQLI